MTYLGPIVGGCDDEGGECVVEGQGAETNVYAVASDNPENCWDEEICKGAEHGH